MQLTQFYLYLVLKLSRNLVSLLWLNVSVLASVLFKIVTLGGTVGDGNTLRIK